MKTDEFLNLMKEHSLLYEANENFKKWVKVYRKRKKLSNLKKRMKSRRKRKRYYEFLNIESKISIQDS